eukprot:TRINITY_DN37725_c2_g1_i1.p1 TRINITY_DN37725_c2_g1~~TRINITY_DN37725_c2_g1_i1.p1  ORF type:complete len:104 (+),score=3.05 TRINITY_DN37725_c2_g1_i1:71-382(+)
MLECVELGDSTLTAAVSRHPGCLRHALHRGRSASVSISFKGLSGYVTSRRKHFSVSAMSLSLRFISAGTPQQYQDFSDSVKDSNLVNLPQISDDAKSYKVAVP